MTDQKFESLKLLAQQAIHKDPELMISYNDFIFLKAYCDSLEKQIKELTVKSKLKEAADE